MDLARAHAVLVVDSSTPHDEVRQRYRMRAQMLHPDRQGGHPDLLAESGRAMAELTEAWAAVQEADRSGNRHRVAPASTPGPAPDPTRLPFVGECDLCGCAPAAPLTLRRGAGMVLFRRTYAANLDLCRRCGLSMFRETQSRTLVWGWWGVIAFFANLANVFGNIGAIRSHQRHLAPPQYRDPAVISPLPPGLPLSKPIHRRVAPMLVSIAVPLLLLGMTASALGNAGTGTSGGDGGTPTVDMVGTCLTWNGNQVSCADYGAQWRITRETPYAASCADFSEKAFEAPDHRIFCATAR